MAASGADHVPAMCEECGTPPAFERRDVSASRSRTVKRTAASRAPADVRRRDAEMVAEGGRVHDLDVAARRRRRDAARCGLQFALAGEGGEENVMVARVLGDQHGAGDGARRIGVLLKGRVPEILRIVLLAGGKADVGAPASRAKASENPTLTLRAVRPAALALEMQRLGGGDAGGPKRRGVRRCIGAFQHQQTKAPPAAAGKSWLKLPNRAENPSPPSFSGSATVSSSMKKPGSWTM